MTVPTMLVYSSLFPSPAMPNAGLFVQSLNVMGAAQTAFGARMGASWLGIGNMFRGVVSKTRAG